MINFEHLKKNDYKVLEILTLGKKNDSEVKKLLSDVAKQVQPLMRKRCLHVPRLIEFYPSNPNLLGLNVGGGGGATREIKIRVRRAHDEDSFFPFNDLLGTMLHELVHNLRGPHDAQFYKMLDEMWEEVEALMDAGISGSGEGFEGASAGRLGGRWRNPDTGDLRDVMARAAAERLKRQRIMSGGPRVLGGRCPLAGLKPAEAAAAAALRRAADNVWCPCGQQDLFSTGNADSFRNIHNPAEGISQSAAARADGIEHGQQGLQSADAVGNKRTHGTLATNKEPVQSASASSAASSIPGSSTRPPYAKQPLAVHNWGSGIREQGSLGTYSAVNDKFPGPTLNSVPSVSKQPLPDNSLGLVQGKLSDNDLKERLNTMLDSIQHERSSIQDVCWDPALKVEPVVDLTGVDDTCICIDLT